MLGTPCQTQRRNPESHPVEEKKPPKKFEAIGDEEHPIQRICSFSPTLPQYRPLPSFPMYCVHRCWS